jgi:hypothetical protein
VTTPAIDNSVTVLRALLTEDMDTFRRLHAAQDEEERRAFAVVLTLAFTMAAVERFGEQPSPDEIIGFVADARARVVGPETVAPADAERVIRAVLGEDDLVETMDGRAYGAAQTSMLFALTHENDASAEHINELLARAAEEAAVYFRRRAGQ